MDRLPKPLPRHGDSPSGRGGMVMGSIEIEARPAGPRRKEADIDALLPNSENGNQKTIDRAIS